MSIVNINPPVPSAATRPSMRRYDVSCCKVRGGVIVGSYVVPAVERPSPEPLPLSGNSPEKPTCKQLTLRSDGSQAAVMLRLVAIGLIKQRPIESFNDHGRG